MLPRIVGTLSVAPSAAVDTNYEHLTLSRFPNGYVSVASTIAVRQDAADFCIACGEPRFDDPDLRALAASDGPAAAWLEAFRRHGTAGPRHVKGRFLAIRVHANDQTLTVATDRFATWPVCYRASATQIAFADRADAVPTASLRTRAQSIFDYVFLHVIAAPDTIFEDVFRLPAAHTLHWQRGRLECEPYWRPVFAPAHRPNLEASKQEFCEIVRNSVEREVSRGRVGAFLSGGTDSSTVAGMMCRILGRPAATYSMGFDAAGYDEMEYARIAATHFGTDHHEYYVTPDDVVTGLHRVATQYDQPFGNSSAVATWCCASRAKADGIERMLAGDGGDELFGGNARYAKQRIFEWYRLVPRLLRTALLDPAARQPLLHSVPLLQKACSYVEQAQVPLPDRLEQYNMLVRIGAATVFQPDYLATVDVEQPLAMRRQQWHSIAAASSIDRMLALDWKYTLADNDLPKVVGMTELAGVSVAFPLLSDDLVDFSLRLPTRWKLKGLTLRWFFKEALSDFLPEAILRKKKHGFGLPFGVWAPSYPRLRELTSDTLASLKRRDIVRPDFIDDLRDNLLPSHPNYYGEMVWILLVLELWLGNMERSRASRA